MLEMLRIMAEGVLGSASDLGVPNNAVGQGSISRIVNLVLRVAGSVSVIVVIISGILYALSTGDPSKAAKARNALIYSIVGLIIVGSAFLLTNLVIGRL